MVLQSALLTLAETATGAEALKLLQLDGVIPGSTSLFDGIRARMRDVVAL